MWCYIWATSCFSILPKRTFMSANIENHNIQILAARWWLKTFCSLKATSPFPSFFVSKLFFLSKKFEMTD